MTDPIDKEIFIALESNHKRKKSKLQKISKFHPGMVMQVKEKSKRHSIIDSHGLQILLLGKLN